MALGKADEARIGFWFTREPNTCMVCWTTGAPVDPSVIVVVGSNRPSGCTFCLLVESVNGLFSELSAGTSTSSTLMKARDLSPGDINVPYVEEGVSKI